jgi:HK97 family phage major capsid protein
METLDQINEKITALSTRAEELLATAEADSGKVAEVKGVIDTEIKPALELLTKDREIAVQAEEMKGLTGAVTTLKAAVEDLRKPSDGFSIDTTSPNTKAVEENNPYADGEFSPFVDVHMANKGSQAARDRLAEGAKALADSDGTGYQLQAEGKAMTEGTGSQGGYLVQPQLERQLVLAREADNVLRGLCSSLNVNTNAIQLDQLGISTTAGWVAELATKPESTAMTLATITASVFTAAGLATISNQLLQDSNPAVDQLVTSDLAKRLVALEEIAFLSGSGSGQPLGLLNTPGLGTQTLTQASLEDPAVTSGLLDTILSSIAEVQTNWGQPSAIVMHPRTWTRILKSRDSVGHYTIAPRSNFGAGYDPATARTFVNGPQQTLFGVEVILSNRIPTNLGSGTNQSRVIVGDFKEALILDRQGITVDESPHVFFTSNQTVFRAESRVGFTAARSPLAFSVIGGTGLANG